MKCMFLIILLQFFGVAVIKATLFCKDNETSAEYVMHNTDVIKSLVTKLVEDGISKKLEDLHKQYESKYDHLLKTYSDLERPTICGHAMGNETETGIYKIYPYYDKLEWFNVVCRRLYGDFVGKWTMVMRRFDGSVNFNRDWTEHKYGFGNLNGEFFIGLEKLHALTVNTGNSQQLLILMRDDQNTELYANYAKFEINDEKNYYSIKELGHFFGNTFDAMHHHLNMNFTTGDFENSSLDPSCFKNRSPWWFENCDSSNLFGRYDELFIWREITATQSVKLRSVEILLKGARLRRYL